LEFKKPFGCPTYSLETNMVPAQSVGGNWPGGAGPRSWLAGLSAGICRPGGQGRYCVEQALAVAKVEPKLPQIGIGQIA
jgi:hypothetical protein